MSRDLQENPLWLILVEAVHSLPLYNHHKAYVKDFLLIENEDISPSEVSQRLDISLGEALVILKELDRGVNY